jgi:hypothetical protein
MKITHWYKRIGAALLASGLLAPAGARAVNIPLPDASFEDFVVPTSSPAAGFAYAGIVTPRYRPTSAWVSRPGAGNYQDGGPTGSNWLYNASYAEGAHPTTKRAAPRTGNQAMHGDGGHVSGQVVSSVFEAGKTYTFSVYAQGDNDAQLLGPPFGYQSRVFLFIYDGDLYGNDITPGVHNEAVRELSLTYDEDENNPLSPNFTYFPHDRFAPPEPVPPDGATMTLGDFVNRNSSWNAAQSRAGWQPISVSWKVLPSAAEVGHKIGVAFKLFADGAVDDASLTATDSLADLNNDLAINAADWALQRNNMHTDLSAFTPAEKYARGDLTGDGLNNYDDFLAFANSYDAANGAGAFHALVGVPEPATAALAAATGALMHVRRRSQ